MTTDDVLPPYTTWNDLSDRYELNHWRTTPCRPNWRSSQSIRRSWSTVSKAAVRSSRHRAKTSPFSAARSRSLYTFVTAIFMVWYWRYADCVTGIRLLLSKNSRSRLYTILSSNLERNDKFETGLKFFIWLVSDPAFFSSGRTTAFLKSDGKQPSASDLLNSNVTNGDNSAFIFLSPSIDATRQHRRP